MTEEADIYRRLQEHLDKMPVGFPATESGVEIKILKVDTEARKIGLSLRRAQWAAEEQDAQASQSRIPTAAQTVLSDADLSKVTKPKGKIVEPQAEQAQPNEPIEPTAESETSNVEQSKASGESEQGKSEDTKKIADSESRPQTTKDSSSV